MRLSLSVRIITLAMVAALAWLAVPRAGAQAPISTVEELQAMQNDLASSYVLTNDIDASDTVNWNGGSGFAPVGDVFFPFLGSLDGAGYTIANLYMDWPTSMGVGLFGATSDSASILQVTLSDSLTSGLAYVGSLAGYNNGAISSCSVSGAVGGLIYIGGIAGNSTSGTLVNCRKTGLVTGGYFVGGVIGYSLADQMSASSHDGVVVGDGFVGGISGVSVFSAIAGCQSAGLVTHGPELAMMHGGLVGQSLADTIVNSHNSAAVTGSFMVGGLVGYGQGGIFGSANTGAVIGEEDLSQSVGGLAGATMGAIAQCYNEGVTSGGMLVGGLVGDHYGSLVNCYNRGPVTAQFLAGGGVGANSDGSVTSDCYHAALVDCAQLAGGFIGSNFATSSGVQGCYWDADITSQTQDVGAGGFDGVTSKTTVEMMQQATFVDWNFANVWGIIETKTYPYFGGSEIPVSIDQALAQDDPTSATPIVFDVVFTQPVTGFTTAGVDFSSSTAPVTDWQVIGEGANYNVIVLGVGAPGLVIPNIPAGVAFAGGAPNLDSTSKDNEVLFDDAPPTGTIEINGGAAATSDTAVTLALPADDGPDGAGVVEMRLRNDADPFGDFVPYAPTTPWTLSAGDGLKTVSVQYRDGAGNLSVPASDTILLDQTPSTGSIEINGGAAATSDTLVELALPADDGPDGAGVVAMRLRNDAEPFGDFVPYAPATTWTLPAAEGEQRVWVQYRDGVGNLSVPASDTIILDQTPPNSAMTGPAGLTVQKTATLTWTSDDPGAAPSGVASVEVFCSFNGGAAQSVGVFPAGVNTTDVDLLALGGGGAFFFYSQATDVAGNVEDGATAPEDGTTVTLFLFPVAQDFEVGDGGWAFGNAAGLLTPAIGEYVSGTLSLTAANNLDCFGFWTSQPDELISVPGALYHGAFTVSSTVADPAQVPITRLRVNSLARYAYVYVIDSHGAADIAPTSAGVVYDLLFTPVPTAELGDGIQLSFDLLNFHPEDAADGQVALEEYRVDLLDQATVDAGLSEIGGYDFASDSQGWSFLGMNLLGGAPPTGEYDAFWPALSIVSSPDNGNVGFWQSPTSPTIAGGTIYALQFSVWAIDDAALAENGLATPNILRLRSNSENGQYTFLLEINRDPTTDLLEPTIVPLYLYPHPLLAGDGLKCAFDLVDFNDNPSTGTILLQDLRILSGPDSLIP